MQSRGSVNELKDWKHNLKFYIKFLDSENMYLLSRLHIFLDYNSPCYANPVEHSKLQGMCTTCCVQLVLNTIHKRCTHRALHLSLI